MKPESPPQNGVDERDGANRWPVASDKKGGVVISVPTVPVTVERRPFVHPEGDSSLLSPGSSTANARQGETEHLQIAPGTPRANTASFEEPDGTFDDDWATHHQHQTVLQQHCDFFGTDRDGIIWPRNTFHKPGFGIVLSLVAVLIIHANFSYPTLPTSLPDPFFRIYVANIHKGKHGSDSGTYDTEGRFVPQKFEDMFAKYADGKDGLSLWDVLKLLKGQRLIADPVGWGGAFIEWLATYIMLWPEDGQMMKDDIRRIYDGSIFYTVAARRAKNEPASSADIRRANKREKCA